VIPAADIIDTGYNAMLRLFEPRYCDRPIFLLHDSICAAGGLRRLRRRSNRYSWRSRRALILRAAKAEYWEENDRQQKQTDSKTDALSETLRDIDAKDDPDNEIHERNEHQDHPPTGPTRDLAQKIGVHNRDDGRPTGLSGFCEDFPQSGDHQNGERQPANPEDWTRCLALR
jgi:hypothetical protein